jgi:CxxC motif-containing protein
MTKNIICIMCPLGCTMEVVIEGSEVKQVTGQRCKKGIKHARQEVLFPGRVLTTTIRTHLLEDCLLPVRSNKEVPKERLRDCIKDISTRTVSGPVATGEVVVRNILNLGIDIIACRGIPHKFPISTIAA